MAVIVHIEHPVHDLEGWRAAFDSDPIGRARMGVRRYRVACSIDDPRWVTIELELDDLSSAEAMVEALHRLWGTPRAQAAMAGTPVVSLLESLETVDLVATG